MFTRPAPAQALEHLQSAVQSAIEAAQTAAYSHTQSFEAEKILSECVEEFARHIYEPATEEHFEHSDGIEEVIGNMDLGPSEAEEFNRHCHESAEFDRVSIYYSDAWDFVNSNTELCDNALEEFGLDFHVSEGLNSLISKAAAWGLMLDVTNNSQAVFEAFTSSLEENLDWLYELRDHLSELEENQEK